MLDAFREFYAPTTDEVDALWSEGLVVLDTNVLLNMYAYPKQSRELWFKVLEILRERGQLWMPHQVGLEYQRNRPAIMIAQKEVYEKLNAGLDEVLKTTTSIDSLSPHPVIDIEKYTGEIREIVDKQKRRIDDAKKRHSVRIAEDPIRDELDSLYGGVVGPALTEKELDSLYAEGERRYAEHVPPGFGDAGKAGDAKGGTCDFGVRREYGDLVLWEQVKRQATASGRPIMLVTDDKKKGDWSWLSKSKANLGTHPILKRELLSVAGQVLLISAPENFLSQASERLEIRNVEKAIAEIQMVDKQTSRRREVEREHMRRRMSVERSLMRATQRCEELEQALAMQRARHDELAFRERPGLEQDPAAFMNARREIVESQDRVEELTAALADAQSELLAMQRMYARLRSHRSLDSEDE